MNLIKHANGVSLYLHKKQKTNDYHPNPYFSFGYILMLLFKLNESKGLPWQTYYY